MTLLLGIDEGTSAVKAVLYDADLRPVAEARREKALSHPRPGWVEQDPEEVLDRRRRRGRRACSRDAPGGGRPRAVSITRASRCSRGTRRPAGR